jgi:uncharacterized protein (TIGR02996 family)
MSDGPALLRALVEAPRDLPRWNVYADWLEEQGGPLAEYVRLSAALPEENEIWYALFQEKRALAPHETAYLEGFKKARPGSA